MLRFPFEVSNNMKKGKIYPISLFAVITVVVVFFSSCYSLNGISIAPDIKTFYVEDFLNNAPNSPVDINQIFAESLREKIRNESRLTYNDRDPDIEFKGQIKGFQLQNIPASENQSALNRLEIIIQVAYVNNKKELESWDNRFSFFQDFESDVDLQSVQDDLIEVIFEQLTEDVFNKAFTNW